MADFNFAKLTGKEALKEQGYFKESDIGVDTFGINTTSKKHLMDEKFRAKCDFTADWDKLVEACNGRQKIYIYTKDKKVRALYLISEDKEGAHCNFTYKSDYLDDDTKKKLDDFFRYYTAKTSMNNGKSFSEFNGEALPKLESKSHFNAALFITFAIIFGMLFSIPTHIWALSGCGIAIAAGLSFQTFYRYVEDKKE